MNRIAPVQRGRYDDVIGWLKQFEMILSAWQTYGRAVGSFWDLARFAEIAPQAGEITALNWRDAVRDKDRTMHWIHVTEAWGDVVHVMEEHRAYTHDNWQTHINNVRIARQWYEAHNDPEPSRAQY